MQLLPPTSDVEVVHPDAQVLAGVGPQVPRAVDVTRVVVRVAGVGEVAVRRRHHLGAVPGHLFTFRHSGDG